MIAKYEIFKRLICAILVFSGLKPTAQDPPNISLIFYLDENSSNGTLVGTVRATDPDGDVLTYSITSGNGAGGFAIGSGSGDITVADETVLDYEVNPVFNLMVEADDGNGGMTTVSVTINLNDIDETVLGIGDDSGISVYPNPVSRVLAVDLGNTQIGAGKIMLYTLAGKRISVIPRMISATVAEIDVSGLKKGVYLLSIDDHDDHPKTIRIFRED